jgi:hypothetical protein
LGKVKILKNAQEDFESYTNFMCKYYLDDVLEARVK